MDATIPARVVSVKGRLSSTSDTTAAVPRSVETHRARSRQHPTRLSEKREKNDDRTDVDIPRAFPALVGHRPRVSICRLTPIMTPKAEGIVRKKGQFLSIESRIAVVGGR